MISRSKNCLFALSSSRRASALSADPSPASSHADPFYEIAVGETTVGPAGNGSYQNGIIRAIRHGPRWAVFFFFNVPQSAAFQYSAANNEINGIAGDYNVSAEASNVHGGTAHAYALNGGFSGMSTSTDPQLGITYPQQGYTGATATVSYSFQSGWTVVRHADSCGLLRQRLCQYCGRRCWVRLFFLFTAIPYNKHLV